jgi:hypothetical protein
MTTHLPPLTTLTDKEQDEEDSPIMNPRSTHINHETPHVQRVHPPSKAGRASKTVTLGPALASVRAAANPLTPPPTTTTSTNTRPVEEASRMFFDNRDIPQTAKQHNKSIVRSIAQTNVHAAFAFSSACDQGPL